MTDDSATSSAAILDVDQLVVRYGARTAVDGVTFQVKRGEIFGLLGPNGAGKTSTLSAIEGLLKPRGGTTLIDGIDMQSDAVDAKSRLGVQLQASSFQSELTIEQIVRLYAGLYGVQMTREAIDDRIREVGLGGELGKRFKSISGGQQQRLSL